MRTFSTFRYFVILFALLCASCGTALPTVKPYKLDVQQGNVVTSKMLLQLRPGMTKSQVRFIMGTPLIQDSFHGNRWDYVYQMREKGKVTDQKRVILDFEGDALKTVRGDVIAKGTSQTKSDEEGNNSGTRVINPEGKVEDKGVLNKLKFWKKDEAEPVKEADSEKVPVEAPATKAEAQATTKNADVESKENLNNLSSAPAEEPQSILAVPLEALPMADVPAPPAEDAVVLTPVTETTQATESAKAPEPVVEEKAEKKVALPPAKNEAAKNVPAKVEKVKTESMKAETSKIVPAPVKAREVVKEAAKPEQLVSKAQKKIENSAAVPKETLQAKVPAKSYESTSGMKFDRNLKFNDEVESTSNAEPYMPRAGNKSVPKPKDLPAEAKPGVLDKTMEKVGF